MRYLIVLLILILPQTIYACGDGPKPKIALEAINTVDPIFRRPQDAGIDGKAKALLKINDMGVVVDVVLVSVDPAKLDKNPIIKAIKKTKFTKGHEAKDYVYNMVFQISEVSF